MNILVAAVLYPCIMHKTNIFFFIASIVIHLMLLTIISQHWPRNHTEMKERKTIRLTLRKPTKAPLKKEEEDFKGQIVELPDPIEEKKPEKAKYLANKAQTVEKETKTERFKVNPEIISDKFSKDDIMKQEDVMDLRIEEHSSGAKVGNNKFRPDRDGNMANLPSKFRLTNKDGFQKPTRASSSFAQQAGAPNNDLLDEETAERLQLNAQAYPYAGYMNQIRRMVNFYWTQNIHNADGPFHKFKYQTGVTVIITKDGIVKVCKIVQESGSTELDDAVVQAFYATETLPRPPDSLLKGKDELRLPDFIFQVNLSAPQQQYSGVDPRSNVQFPGMLKIPR